MKIRCFYEVENFVTITTGPVVKQLNSIHLLRSKSQRTYAVEQTRLVVIQLINRFHWFVEPRSTQHQQKNARLNTILTKSIQYTFSPTVFR